MSRQLVRRRREVLAGLVLFCSVPLAADEGLRDTVRKQLRDESYILVEDHGSARLYVLGRGAEIDTVLAPLTPVPGSIDAALVMTRSADRRDRVRGLTLLAGETDVAAHDAALALLSDPSDAVREEAYNVLLDHPHTDIHSIARLAQADKSPLVRQAAGDQNSHSTPMAGNNGNQ